MEYDYVIVGSGAGGGTLAARLVEFGHRVLLLESGGDPRFPGGDAGAENFNYSVPALHARASEDPRLAWNFFVEHFADGRQAADSKKVTTTRGDRIYYPRAGTWGGCTSHHALITHYPHDSDWEHLRTLTGDPSWHPIKMREIFERIEHCDYVLRELGDQAQHGFNGWLHTEVADLELAVKDKQLLAIVAQLVPEISGPLAALRDRGGFTFAFFADLAKLALEANLAILAASLNPLHALLTPVEIILERQFPFKE